MGRSSWAIILACILGAIFFGMLQRGCGLGADSPVVLVPPESRDTAAQDRVAPSARSSTRFAQPPPRPTARQPADPSRGRGAREAITSQIQRPQTLTPADPAARAEALRRARDEALAQGAAANARANARRNVSRQTEPETSGVPEDSAERTGQIAEAALGQQSTPFFAQPPISRRGVASGRTSNPMQGLNGANADGRSNGPPGQSNGGVLGNGLLVTSGGGGGGPVVPPPNGNGGGGGNGGDPPPSETPNPPGAFTLQSPPNNQTGLGLSPTLTWTRSNNAASYRVEIASDSGFADIVHTATLSGLSYTTPPDILAPGATYHWRVTALRNSGAERVSGESFVFVVLPAPGPFAVTAPASNATQGLVGPVTLAWNDSDGAEAYSLVVATDAALTNTIVAEPALTDTTYTIGVALNEGATYHWRVVATNAVGSRTASPQTAQFRMLGPPGPFTLLTPSDGDDAAFIPVVLTWSPAIDAKEYRVEVATDSGFAQRVVNVVTTQPMRLLTADDIDDGVTYFWRVSAINSLDVRGSTPAVATFTTRPGPGAFALRTPADGATIGLPVSLQWDESPNALAYTVQLATSADFADPIVSEFVIPLLSGGTFFDVPDELLEVGQTYFWRVVAGNEVREREAIVSPFAFTIGVTEYDLNDDGVVDVRDLYAYHALPSPPDLNADGVADDSDRRGLRDAIRDEERAKTTNAPGVVRAVSPTP
ncbi:MAG: hypothetical protein EA379_05815 [Phycisphaerales bacterium]|nr:MAG: hypothetical protein EA379_05815 [Phycisphaerales bacterium]